MEVISLTEQLQRFSDGDRQLAEDLLQQILPDLHRIAVRELGRERFVAPCSATELTNESWFCALHKGGWELKSRAHFYSIAALVMRHVLVDYARKRKALRRGQGHSPQTLNPQTDGPSVGDHAILIEMGILMGRLDAETPGMCARCGHALLRWVHPQRNC